MGLLDEWAGHSASHCIWGRWSLCSQVKEAEMDLRVAECWGAIASLILRSPAQPSPSIPPLSPLSLLSSFFFFLFQELKLWRPPKSQTRLRNTKVLSEAWILTAIHTLSVICTPGLHPCWKIQEQAYMCVRVSVHVWIWVHVHVCQCIMHRHVHASVCICTCVCMYAHTNISVNVCLCEYTCGNMSACVCTLVHTWTCMCMY